MVLLLNVVICKAISRLHSFSTELIFGKMRFLEHCYNANISNFEHFESAAIWNQGVCRYFKPSQLFICNNTCRNKFIGRRGDWKEISHIMLSVEYLMINPNGWKLQKANKFILYVGKKRYSHFESKSCVRQQSPLCNQRQLFQV